MAGQDFDKLYELKDGQTQIIQSPVSEAKESFTKTKNRTIDNLNAIEYLASPSPAPKNSSREIGVIIDANGTLVIITTNEKHRSEFETILKTFQYNP